MVDGKSLVKRFPIFGVFWINGIFFVISLIAELLKEQFAAVAVFGIQNSVGAQLILFFLSSAVAVILAQVRRVQISLEGGLSSMTDALLQKINGIDDRQRQVRDELARGIIQHEGKSYRSLRYDLENGTIYYGEVNPGNRNVLFNNETIKRILQKVQHYSKELGRENSSAEGLLYQLGYAASSGFAEHFQYHCNAKGIEYSLEAWLKEWTHYDSDAGFGHMEVLKMSSDAETATVDITNNFLTHGNDYGGKYSLCEFMIGYIEGLLKSFSGGIYNEYQIDKDRITVKHDLQRDCCHHHENVRLGCRFLVIVPKVIDESTVGTSDSGSMMGDEENEAV